MFTSKAYAAAGDTVATLGLVSTIFGYLPAATALLCFVWYAIQVYESKTFKRVQAWLVQSVKAAWRF